MKKRSQKPTTREIAIRAYYLFVERGYPDGQAQEHWLEAEQSLIREMACSPGEVLTFDAVEPQVRRPGGARTRRAKAISN